MQQSVRVLQNNLATAILTRLRDERTTSKEFRQLLNQLSRMLAVPATADLVLEQITISTPLETMVGHRLAESIGIACILRASLGMVDSFLELIPDATVWHFGLKRDEETHRPHVYYDNRDGHTAPDVFYVLDPMLATGGTAIEMINILKEWGVTKIIFVGIIAAPEGILALRETHPDVNVFVAAIDRELNNNAYILPGLGDAGDRQFGT